MLTDQTTPDTPVVAIFAERLRRARGEYRSPGFVSRRRIADELGLHPETVGRFERAETEPTLTQAWQIAELIGVPLAMLLPHQAAAQRAEPTISQIADALVPLIEEMNAHAAGCGACRTEAAIYADRIIRLRAQEATPA